MEAEEFQEGDYVLFGSKDKPEIEYLGRITINDWCTQYIVKPDYDVYALKHLKESFNIREFTGVTRVKSLEFDLDGDIIVKKITEKEYFYRKLKGVTK